MRMLNRDNVRETLNTLGITTSSVTTEQLILLNKILNAELIDSKIYRSTARMQKPKRPFFQVMRCDSWKGREAISFNPDGFIGFAGWADNKNIQPILAGVLKWATGLKESE